MIIDSYISYVKNIKRYSSRTVQIYKEVIMKYATLVFGTDDVSDSLLLESLNPSEIRSYEVRLMDEEKMVPKTVRLHLSALSGFCRYLVKEGHLQSNPVRLVPKPKVEKRLPEFYRHDSMDAYFEKTAYYVSDEAMTIYLHDVQSDTGKKMYERRLARLIISMFYGLGLRRSELIGLQISSVDFSRKVVTVHGKGNKTRAIPLADSLAVEIRMYLKAAEALVGLRAVDHVPVSRTVDHVPVFRTPGEPLLVTYTGRALYPVYVDRVVKTELGGFEGFTGRKSPHVLRHSIATSLLNEGAQLNSIKEMLGHSSLAATQVYTHNSITKLQQVYRTAHPRAKK